MVSAIPHGAVELKDEAMKQNYLVNGQYVKHYYGEDTSKDEEAIDLVNDE